jgi:hypothetical protein
MTMSFWRSEGEIGRLYAASAEINERRVEPHQEEFLRVMALPKSEYTSAAAAFEKKTGCRG